MLVGQVNAYHLLRRIYLRDPGGGDQHTSPVQPVAGVCHDIADDPAFDLKDKVLYMPCRLLSGMDCPRRAEVYAEKNTSVGDAKRAIRTARYKLIRNLDQGPALALPVDIEVTATRRDMGDAHLAPRPPLELYDLESDPWEQRNLAADHACRSVVADLNARLQRWMEETADPVLDGPVPRPPREAEIMAAVRDAAATKRRQEREAANWREYQRLKTGG